jgi:hypothetical protein
MPCRAYVVGLDRMNSPYLTHLSIQSSFITYKDANPTFPQFRSRYKRT